MFRSSSTRWDSQYDEANFHNNYFAFIPTFYYKVVVFLLCCHLKCHAQASNISDSETIKALESMVKSSAEILKAQLAYVVNVMKPLYEAIHVLQKQSGGMFDVMQTFDR